MDHPEFAGKDLNAISVDAYREMRNSPAVYFIHGETWQIHRVSRFLMKQPANSVLFEDQIFVGDQTRSNLMRIVLEKVQGAYQGGDLQFH